ncbi:MAG TPA: tripartite tricarboxylate transporter substrate binding protein [Candidatus Aphodousia gallistercoris]|nr:tripartite tricarboxylate transporter substrate binding protein [Candidatus Aphodousia gallistercoris]
MLSRRLFIAAAAALPLAALAKARTMRIIVPYPAGGPLDASARFLSEALKSRWGKTVVDNRPGAAGARGMQAAKTAAPDGKTLVVGALATLAVNPYIQKGLPYEAGDFTPVALLSDAPNVLVMTPQTMKKWGLTDAASLLAYIKAHPGELNFASGGNGSAGHLAGLVLGQHGYPMVHIPYAGAQAAQLSVFSGETDLMFDNWGSCREAIEDGRLKALAVTTEAPYEPLAVPTLKSLGIACDLSTWFGLLAPKGTDPALCQTLFEDIRYALSLADSAALFDRIAGGMKLLNPQDFARWIAKEQVKYETLLKSLSLS